MEAKDPFAKLRSYGYVFNAKGELRQVDPESGEVTDKKFAFNVKDGDQEFNQKRYEDIGDIITECVYEYLQQEPLNLKKIDLSGGSFIFASKDLDLNEDKLMILIHGSGVVRAGQWARRLIMNNSLREGTQFEYIKRAKKEGFAVLVLNTNQNEYLEDGKKLRIPNSETPQNHARNVWSNIISKAPAKHIAIVAHSFGGVVTVDLAEKFTEDFQQRVFAVMFTDSVHRLKRGSSKTAEFLGKVGLNYVASDKEVGTSLNTVDAISAKSAGHTSHEWTSASSFENLFQMVLERYKEI